MASDEELMVAYRTGDSAAFRELFERHASKLFLMLRRDVANAQDAEDLVQQTFLQLHRARYDYQASRPLRPWLLTIAFNLKRQYFRDRKRRPPPRVDIADIEAADPNARADRGAEAEWVRNALQQLPATQRDAIILHHFEGLSFAEVAAIVGGSAGAAKIRAHRGMQSLRKKLGDPETERLFEHKAEKEMGS